MFPLLIIIDEEELVKCHVAKIVVGGDETVRVLIQEVCHIVVAAKDGLEVFNELVELQPSVQRVLDGE